MKTPIVDFLTEYQKSNRIRFHMPGHKGTAFLGCEELDITEIFGADALYEAKGIIAESEKNASDLFGSAATLYSTEGSTQCIKAMLYLALSNRPKNSTNTVVAARNAHKAFVYAAALLDFETVWLMPEKSGSLCSCNITAQRIEATLSSLPKPPAAVYITSVDYLGNIADIKSLAKVCHKYGTLLTVDNAHGAYLKFLSTSQHPLDMGADICCDSAHKTLPVLTGGAYLHISKNAPVEFKENAKSAMALFGSTSPSYLTLASLDMCNCYISQGYSERLSAMIKTIESTREKLKAMGWCVENSDPLRITIALPDNVNGGELLRRKGIECEYSDPDYLVLMLTPENTEAELSVLTKALGENTAKYSEKTFPIIFNPKRVLSIREAVFAHSERVNADKALGRICGAPTVACPPAIPIAISGEKIDENMIKIFKRYGIDEIDVLK